MNAVKSGAHVRAEAARTIDAVVSAGRSLDAALQDSEANVSADERPLLRLLCYGCLRYHWRLRAELRELLQRPLKARDSVVESLLVVGLYQLSDTRVPDHAAVSMTVEATRQLRRPKLAGLVNAVLRNFIRHKPTAQAADTASLVKPMNPEDSIDPVHTSDPVNPADAGFSADSGVSADPGICVSPGVSSKPGVSIDPSVSINDEQRFNHPAWLIAQLQRDWPERWADIIAANNERAPMWLRVNSRYGSAADYMTSHALEGTLLPGAAQALCLAKPLPVEALPGFADGQVSVQDAAAQLAAPWLLGDGGRRVLDACAAPGGKTGHLLELLAELEGPAADLTAIDVAAERLQGVHENLARLGLAATVLAADASNPESWWDGTPFDRILLDAPCSATGVIRRHPDIKILRRESDIAALASLQRDMLESLWSVLAPGGRLLYVTCSVLNAENAEVVGRFLKAHPEASEDRVLHDYNIRDLMCARASGFQVLPGTKGLDGFYFASLMKASPEPKTS